MARQATETTTDDRIAAVLEQLAANAPAPEIGFGHPKYQERLREEGVFADFPVPVYQNGKKAQARGLQPETISRVAELKPGRYLGGKVEVARDAKNSVHLLYKTGTPDDRMRFYALAPDFDTLIGKIWAEQTTH